MSGAAVPPSLYVASREVDCLQVRAFTDCMDDCTALREIRSPRRRGAGAPERARPPTASQSINKSVNNILGISMDFEITRDVRNELLKRRELTFTLTFDGPTPSRKSIQEKLAALQNKNENLIVLDLERTRFGKMELFGRARIYDDEETKTSTEREYLLKRGEPKAESEA